MGCLPPGLFFVYASSQTYLHNQDVDVTALAELIVQEKGLGSIVHCAGETDVFALATTLNVQAHQGNPGMQSLCDKLLRKRCPPSLQPALAKALGSPETFVFLHGRFVNLPLPLIPLLHKSSHEDMAWAQSSDVRSSLSFHVYMSVYQYPSSSSSCPPHLTYKVIHFPSPQYRRPSPASSSSWP